MEAKIYQTIMSLKAKYPEGLKWTDETPYSREEPYTWEFITGKHIYRWHGTGCVAFAYILSDAAFGPVNTETTLPPRKTADFTMLRAGDILRLDNDTHTVVVLSVSGDTMTVVEANYNESVHWGRQISISQTKSTWSYLVTRYPESE